MKLLINLVRNLLGSFIAAIDLITRGAKKTRTPDEQRQVEKAIHGLSLYQFFACPFCIKTRRVMHKLNLPIVRRNASKSPFREELLQQGGKIQTPCLRIEEGEKVVWMYESSEIIKYLEERFS
ncbi:glutathione S-transferase N-terminal domain-containing protein [Paraglaciecola sp. 2405UD69-4]|uniref:glutathione S-transferase N-terminal domain-containing protein n=1 Tax=Paraglaciecola sp. 2405UD69-4 TaxID=3391836 RepID=UPI0039C957F3